MIKFTKKGMYICGGIVAGILLLSTIYFGFIFQPVSKTDDLYSEALTDFQNGKYQNAYYLFSKVSFFSNLKPVAVYHQGECANMLDDSKSAVKQYSFLFNNYSSHPLSLRAKYLAAQDLVKINPKRAKKYFERIKKTAPNTEYGIASEYYLGLIILNKYTDENGNETLTFPLSEKRKAENYFRHYLTKAPAGRLGFNTINSWLKLKTEIDPDDYLLMSKTAYAFADYKKSKILLSKTDIAESWPQRVKTAYALRDYVHAKYYAGLGVKNYSKYVEEDELFAAIDTYIKLSKTKSTAISELTAMSPVKGRDYLLDMRCRSLSGTAKTACYNTLYLQYPNGSFAAEALSNIFLAKVKSKDYIAAQKIGNDHLRRFPYSNSAPMVMFWLGKIGEAIGNYDFYTNKYRDVISNYPDTYYAYRAYLRLNRRTGPLVLNDIEEKPVVYPYRYANKNLIVRLVKLNDYDVVDEICNNDAFIKSWVLYKKGDYTNSVIVARDAMEKLNVKPDKYDLRWRLVYPVNYYDIVKRYARYVGNNAPLMMALMKEESHFDPLAQSAAGASGLMQIMPSTARDIARRHYIGKFEIFNPDTNIMLGNYYYSDLRSVLGGFDVSAIAAYNGGAGALQHWKSTLNYNDTDEFVEQIPYEETQNYVKKVFRSYWNYIRIYSGE